MRNRRAERQTQTTRRTASAQLVYDAAVIGGGPAGAVAARELAHAGARVVLLERARLPRQKTCGGGILARARALMPAGMQRAFCETCGTVELTIGSRPFFFAAHRPQAVIYMADRRRLDSLLVAAAGRCGAEIVDACRVDGIAAVRGGLSVATCRGRFKARFVIAADGALSATARRCGWPVETRRLVPALSAELNVPAGIFGRWQQPVRARFDFGAVPRGYGWIFPKAGHLSVGVVSMQSKTTGLKQALQHYLKAAGLGGTAPLKTRGALIPVSPRTDGFAKGRVLLAGDAAGLADPLTAEGISHALLSGRLAAQALVAAEFTPPAARRIYHAKLKAHILAELRIAGFFARRVFFRPRLVDAFFSRRGQAFVEGVTDLATGRQTYRRLLLNPGNYLKLLPPLPRIR